MDFDFNSDQYMLRDSVRRFLDDQAGPAQVRASGAAFDAQLWQGLCELGLPSLLVPEAHEGTGLGLLDAALLWEDMGRALLPAPLIQTMVVSDTLVRQASAEQAAQWLPALASGQARWTWAQHEADRDPSWLQVQARPQGQGWQINGQKMLVPAAASATHLLVSARGSDGQAGLFVCEVGAAGLTIAPHHSIDDHSGLCKVSFAATPAQPLAGGTQAVERLLNVSALAASLQMVGVATAAMDLALDYAKQRSQFGQPIGAFQAIKHKFVDMLVALEGARSCAYHAAWALADEDSSAPVAVSMAKAASSDMCRLVCNEALQIHGGVGFTHAFDVHWFMRRGKYLEHAFGDASWHRERVAANLLDASLPA